MCGATVIKAQIELKRGPVYVGALRGGQDREGQRPEDGKAFTSSLFSSTRAVITAVVLFFLSLKLRNHSSLRRPTFLSQLDSCSCSYLEGAGVFW